MRGEFFGVRKIYMDENGFNKELGKYLLDVSKLVFGGTVLASILKIENINYLLVIISGFTITIFLAYIGFIILKGK